MTYLTECSMFQVRVSIDVDDDLDIVTRDVPENGLVRVKKGTGTPFSIKLKPRSVWYSS